MTALTNAIQTVTDAKATVESDQDVTDVVDALNSAIDTFNTAKKDGLTGSR